MSVSAVGDLRAQIEAVQELVETAEVALADGDAEETARLAAAAVSACEAALGRLGAG